MLVQALPQMGSDCLSLIKGNFKHYFAFLETDCKEIITVSRTLQSKTSSGYDSLPTDNIKLDIQFIATCFSKMANKSFTTGMFPDPLKIARVNNIFKAGDRSNASNYISVSVLPSFAK
jgi:hypothetical protein